MYLYTADVGDEKDVDGYGSVPISETVIAAGRPGSAMDMMTVIFRNMCPS